MKLKFAPSLEVAHRVLRLIDVPEEVARLIDVQSYSNGREQGLAARMFSRGAEGKLTMICWSESRNTDEIVVYVGAPGESFCNGNIPTDRSYAARKIFSAPRQAASYIASILKTRA